MPTRWHGVIGALLWVIVAGHAGLARAQPDAQDEVGSSPPAGYSSAPDTANSSTIWRWQRGQDKARYSLQEWIAEPVNQAIVGMYASRLKREAKVGTNEVIYTLDGMLPTRALRWQAQLGWKLLVGASGDDATPGNLIVTIRYEQPSLSRFDEVIAVTGKNLRGIYSRVVDESASMKCLSARADCRHTEEIMLEVPRGVLRDAMATGLVIDLQGYGRTERLAISKEAITALGQMALWR